MYYYKMRPSIISNGAGITFTSSEMTDIDNRIMSYLYMVFSKAITFVPVVGEAFVGLNKCAKIQSNIMSAASYAPYVYVASNNIKLMLGMIQNFDQGSALATLKRMGLYFFKALVGSGTAMAATTKAKLYTVVKWLATHW